jgi:RimJ/RimL family protein N-acetyltransferase
MTLHYVYDQHRNVARFVAHLIPHIDPAGFPDKARAIGITDARNVPLAGIVFYDWNQRAGTVYVAGAARTGARWFSRETVRRTFEYAFAHLRCQMVIMRVLANNRSLLRQLKAFGCTFIVVPRLYGRADDGVICTYTAEQWAESKFNRPPAARQEEAA